LSADTTVETSYGNQHSEEMRKTIENVTPDRFREINLKVFDAGYKEGLAGE
jgi:hypothetical protein